MNYHPLLVWLSTKTPTARRLIYDFIERATQGGFTNVEDLSGKNLEPRVLKIDKKEKV